MPLLVLVIGKTDTHIYRNLQNIVVYKWLILFGSTPIFLIKWLDGYAVQDLFWYLGLHLIKISFFFSFFLFNLSCIHVLRSHEYKNRLDRKHCVMRRLNQRGLPEKESKGHGLADDIRTNTCGWSA